MNRDEKGRELLRALERASAPLTTKREEACDRLDALGGYLDTQAERIATLEAENERLRKRVGDLDRVVSESEVLLNEWCEGVEYYGGVDDFIAFRLRPALTHTEDDHA